MDQPIFLTDIIHTDNEQPDWIQDGPPPDYVGKLSYGGETFTCVSWVRSSSILVAFVIDDLERCRAPEEEENLYNLRGYILQTLRWKIRSGNLTYQGHRIPIDHTDQNSIQQRVMQESIRIICSEPVGQQIRRVKCQKRKRCSL